MGPGRHRAGHLDPRHSQRDSGRRQGEDLARHRVRSLRGREACHGCRLAIKYVLHIPKIRNQIVTFLTLNVNPVMGKDHP